jgi:hypothetical protein
MTHNPLRLSLANATWGWFYGFFLGIRRDSCRVGHHVTTQHPKPPLPPS